MIKHPDQWTLGQFIDALSKVEQHRDICFEFCHLYPTTLNSYRGYYDDVAVGVGDKPVTVNELVANLTSKLGTVMTGYKGGNYLVGRTTPLWVANWGCVGSTFVKGIYATYCIFILTGNEDV